MNAANSRPASPETPMSMHPFDRSGLACIDDLTNPACRELFDLMEREQGMFLAHEAEFRSPEYGWPRDPLHTWSRCWEYPYVYQALRSGYGRLAEGRQPLLVDVGSGVTFFPFAVAKLGYRVVCTDVDPVCCRDLRKAARVVSCSPGSVDFKPCSLEHLPFEDQECDGICCISVIEHVPDPPATVREMFRILKKNGLLSLTIDLDLRGDHEIGPRSYLELHRALRSCFELAAPEYGIHPATMLTSTTGPYPVGIRPGLKKTIFQVKQLVKPLMGRRPMPAAPFLLAVEGSLWRKP